MFRSYAFILWRSHGGEATVESVRSWMSLTCAGVWNRTWIWRFHETVWRKESERRHERTGYVCTFCFRWCRLSFPSLKSQTQPDKKMRHVTLLFFLFYFSQIVVTQTHRLCNSTSGKFNKGVLFHSHINDNVRALRVANSHLKRHGLKRRDAGRGEVEVWGKETGSEAGGNHAEGLTRPAMGVGSRLIFFTRAGLMELSSLPGDTAEEA